MADTTEKEINVTLDEKGVPVWKDAKGNFIPGLQREHFVNEETKKIDSQHCWKQFYLYQVEFKKARAAAFQAKTDALLEEAKLYAEKSENVGKELSQEDKDKLKLAKLEKAIEAQKKSMGL